MKLKTTKLIQYPTVTVRVTWIIRTETNVTIMMIIKNKSSNVNIF